MNCPHLFPEGCVLCKPVAEQWIRHGLAVVRDLAHCTHPDAADWCAKCGARWTIDGWQFPRMARYAKDIDRELDAIDPDTRRLKHPRSAG